MGLGMDGYAENPGGMNPRIQKLDKIEYRIYTPYRDVWEIPIRYAPHTE
jgi:hypothetical protein